jgi:SAM-dependent methyltransferase
MQKGATMRPTTDTLICQTSREYPIDFTTDTGAGRQQMFRTLLRQFGPGAGRTLLDLGAGPCTFARIARDLGWNVTAVDARTERVPDAETIAGIRFIQGDVRAFDVTGYDVVCILGLLYHLDLPDQMDLLRRVNRSPVILDTQYHDPARLHGLGAWESAVVARGGYRGVLYPEKDTLFAGWGNATSFWPTEESLLRMIEDAGYGACTVVSPSYVSPQAARRFFVLSPAH